MTSMSRHSWIAASIGRVLRQGHATDPDWIFVAAGELYLESRAFESELVADAGVGPSFLRSTSGPPAGPA